MKRTKGGINYRRKGFSLDGVTYKNRDIPGDPIEKHVWETIHQMIYRPGELFDVFKRQSIDSGEYNDLMKERMGDEIDKFQSDMERYKEVSQVLSDSHKRLVCLAVGKSLGTYVDGEPFEDARDNIRLSHLKPFI